MTDWLERFRELFKRTYPTKDFTVGVYDGGFNTKTGRGVIVVGHGVDDKVFEVEIWVKPDERIRLVTDSAEVLRGIMSREFPLDNLARVLAEPTTWSELAHEIVFDLAKINRDKTLEDMRISLRIVQTATPNIFELRAIK